jgi:small subunit ribosomal protein S11
MKTLKKESLAFIYINCTYKNTLITVTNTKREPLFQKSSRSYDLKIKRKNNPYILSQITSQIIYNLKKLKYKQLGIYIKGVGAGRYNILKHLIKKFKIILIQDSTRIPFNGCRQRKKKRK